MPCSSELVVRLYEIEAVKFGNFTLKSGITSPVYFDLRVIVSYPDVMKEVSELLWEKAKEARDSFKLVCGVPYTALPLASVICVSHNLPMLIRRKEAKDYGTKKLIEGHFKAGDECLVVEDVVTSGSSVLETVEALESVGVHTKHAVVLLDREQGGKEALARKGITLHSVCTLTEVTRILVDKGKISENLNTQVHEFIKANIVGLRSEDTKQAGVHLSYEERAQCCKNPMAKRLLAIMAEKKTNVMVSVDLVQTGAVLELVDKVGPFVCGVKTHVDILQDFSPEFVQQLRKLADKHNFVVMEDRKFADIGHTVSLQYGEGLYRIAEWADLVTVHAVPGPGVLQGLKQVQSSSTTLAAVLVAEMSSEGNLAKGDYSAATLKMAETHKEVVVGLVCQSPLTSDPGFILMTPGVKLSAGSDDLGQKYNSPDEVVRNQGADVIIVGRGITGAPDPAVAAQEYQQAGFHAYTARVSGTR